MKEGSFMNNPGPETTSTHPANLAVQREMEIARRIQASFLPKSLPQPAGWEIASHFQAARQVAGDFYDAFPLSGGKRIGLVMADVCDKGVGAALFMALFRSLLRAFADQHYSLSWMDVLASDRSPTDQRSSVGRRRELLSTGTTALKNAIELTNKYIIENHGDSNMFATIFFGVLDPLTGLLVYINAGHEPPVLVGQETIKARLEPTGPAVGLWPGVEFRIRQVEIEPMDTLFTFTDGVMDARNSGNESFGEERLLSLATEPQPSASAILDRIRTELDQHIAGTVQYDDITMLAVRRSE
jgi:sigma-B regulation protein RsbU (phosphoserine phosphatase)